MKVDGLLLPAFQFPASRLSPISDKREMISGCLILLASPLSSFAYMDRRVIKKAKEILSSCLSPPASLTQHSVINEKALYNPKRLLLLISMAYEDLTDTDKKLYEYIKQGDYTTKPWSTPAAAKTLGVSEDAIYQSLSNLATHIKDNIHIFYEDGAIRVCAE